jgi:hypothetical protein
MLFALQWTFLDIQMLIFFAFDKYYCIVVEMKKKGGDSIY